MTSNFFTKAISLQLVVSLILLTYSGLASADDTEVYQSSENSSSSGRPKVLIVFDDSGSMGAVVTGQSAAYSAAGSYPSIHPSGRIYFSKEGDDVPREDSENWFPVNANYCGESLSGLSAQGFFQTNAGFQWQKERNKWQWEKIKKAQIYWVVDCWEDLQNSNNYNGSAAVGYPKYEKRNNPSTPNYASTVPGPRDKIWGLDEAYTWYSAHYMDWLYDSSQQVVDRTRIEIAQDVISSIVAANTGIDFGLMEFNGGWSNPTANGGRVLHRIIENMSTSDRDNVVNLVDDMKAGGSTPLCETSYEAYLYLAGKHLKWGADRDTTRSNWDEIPRDTSAELSSGKYDSPVTGCAYTYVIIMTDGEPKLDQSANDLIEALSGKTCSNYPNYNGDQEKHCLPELAEYMANNDLDGDPTNGNQFGITYTIGFNTDQSLLSDTAEKGKGQYYTADTAAQLTTAFQGAVLSILTSDSTFTSPAVAVDTFTRTRSRNDVFFAMFKPSSTVDWVGNIKKLKLSIASGVAVLVDRLGNPVIDSSTGIFKDSISTFWSDADGGSVEVGGVGALLVSRDPAGRSIKSNTGANGALEVFNSANMTRNALGFSTDAELFAFFGVTSQSELDVQLEYGRGFDVDANGGITTATREWILGDILHSQPLIINYGARSGFSVTNPDLRIIAGTNAGFLHMFGDSDGQEDWAFFPKELAPILIQRYENILSDDHIYGIDSPAVAYIKDKDYDGTIESGDKVWTYFGLRRGGRILYALDLSNPDSPAYMWGIDPASTGFSELGQTWSTPVITHIPGYHDAANVPKPVLIVGAGYDVNKDTSGVATTDSMGRGVFIIDAATGELVWGVTPGANTAKNLQETGLQHSVPGQIAAVDSNGNQLTDRIYFADTGGNIWRVDMAGSTLPTISQNTWRITKLADFNGGTVATDRRFFYAPDVVRIRRNGAPVDAVLIGSGDRTNPNATDVNNRFYAVNDEAIKPYTTAPPSSSACSATPPNSDFRCKLPLGDADLFDVTSNVLVTGTNSGKAIALTALTVSNGLRLDLAQSGEKVTGKSFTINGRGFIPTFTPDDDSSASNVCEPEAGQGLLYFFDIYNGDRQTVNLGPILPDSPSAHFGEDGKIRLLLPPGSPPDNDGAYEDICANGICDLGEMFRAPYGTYWFQEEY